MAHSPTHGPAPRIVRTSDNPPILTRSDWSLIVIGLAGRKWDDPANAEQARQIIDKITKGIP